MDMQYARAQYQTHRHADISRPPAILPSTQTSSQHPHAAPDTNYRLHPAPMIPMANANAVAGPSSHSASSSASLSAGPAGDAGRKKNGASATTNGKKRRANADESDDSATPNHTKSREGPKKKKAARACFHCQKAHLTCDDSKSIQIIFFSMHMFCLCSLCFTHNNSCCFVFIQLAHANDVLSGVWLRSVQKVTARRPSIFLMMLSSVRIRCQSSYSLSRADRALSFLLLSLEALKKGKTTTTQSTPEIVQPTPPPPGPVGKTHPACWVYRSTRILSGNA